MKKNSRTNLFFALLMVMLLGSTSWAASMSISGSVTNTTGKSGRIYLSVTNVNGGNTNLGTSIAGPGSFTINGLQQTGSYVVNAFVDTVGAGIQHANDPVGHSTSVNVVSGNTNVGSFPVSAPQFVPAEASEVIAYKANGGNILLWKGHEDNNGNPIAEKYNIYWSTSPTGSPISGSKLNAPAGGKDFFLHSGGTANLYYRVEAVVTSGAAPSGWTPVTSNTGTTITGSVSFAGITPTGPLYVVLVNEGASGPPIYPSAAIVSPVSPQSYTINNVPPGTYQIHPILDQNKNGTYDIGDITINDNIPAQQITVAASPLVAPTVALTSKTVSASVTTNHYIGDSWEGYDLNLSVKGMTKQPVAVSINSGFDPALNMPIDLAQDGDSFRGWFNSSRPAVGNTYQMIVTYADSTTETVFVSVSGLLEVFPTPLTPIGPIPYNNGTPTFSWSAPSPAPVGTYTYSLWLNPVNGDSVWDLWDQPSTLTSIVYNADGNAKQAALSDGVEYAWQLSVSDSNGNQASQQVNFRPTTSPAITSFTPTGGLAGAVVTINGINFSTTPSSNTVSFNGTPATVTAATSTSLTVTVPVAASTGSIQLSTSGKPPITSNKIFIVGAPTIIQGVIKTSAGIAIAGAKVEVQNESSSYATTAANGSFILNSFQNNNISLKITKTGYVPTYTRSYSINGNLDLTPYPIHLYTQAELTSWGVIPGKGVIVGQILNNGTTPYSAVSNVVVYSQSNNKDYPVTYYNGTNFGGSATYSNGLFFVKNLPPYAWVGVTPIKSAWSFSLDGVNVYPDSVTEGGFFGWAQAPVIYNISSLTGHTGSSITISGNYFSEVIAENAVKFNGIAATVTAASSNLLTVTVPATATTGSISVTTAGGTYAYWQSFTILNELTVAVVGGAGGTVTSSPAGIACTTSNCIADFNQGTVIDLIATAGGGYRFKTWSGACTGTTSPCLLTLSSDKSVTATFEQLLYIKNGTNYYSTLQNAFDVALNNEVIQVQAQTFTDLDLVFNRPGVQVKFKGGYDNAFTSNSGYTTLDGKLSIRDGALLVEKIIIK